MTVNINNTTNKIVKKIKISGESECKGHILVPAVLVSGMGNVRPGPCRRTDAAPSRLPQWIRSRTWFSTRWINTRRPCAWRRSSEQKRSGTQRGTGEKREEANEEWVVTMVLKWAAKKKNKSVLEEQMLRKQRRGKAVDTEPPSTSLGMSLGEGAQLSPGCFLSPFCILRPAAVRQGPWAPEKEEGQSKGGGVKKKKKKKWL